MNDFSIADRRSAERLSAAAREWEAAYEAGQPLQAPEAELLAALHLRAVLHICGPMTRGLTKCLNGHVHRSLEAAAACDCPEPPIKARRECACAAWPLPEKLAPDFVHRFHHHPKCDGTGRRRGAETEHATDSHFRSK